MQYMGGKSRISKALSEVILAHTAKRKFYIEPFVGGGAMAEKMAPHFKTVVLNDLHEDLMLMWDAVLNTDWIPPTEVSLEQYQELRYDSEPSALRGFVGFGCSFGGKWFGGYARSSKQNTSSMSFRTVIRQREKLQGSLCLNKDFRELFIPSGSVVYCDPPYSDTTGYSTDSFPHEDFWAKAQQWAEAGADVFVSEYSAPVGWEAIWERTIKTQLHKSDNSAVKGTEKLFVWKGNK